MVLRLAQWQVRVSHPELVVVVQVELGSLMHVVKVVTMEEGAVRVMVMVMVVVVVMARRPLTRVVKVMAVVMAVVKVLVMVAVVAVVTVPTALLSSLPACSTARKCSQSQMASTTPLLHWVPHRHRVSSCLPRM